MVSPLSTSAHPKVSRPQLKPCNHKRHSITWDVDLLEKTLSAADGGYNRPLALPHLQPPNINEGLWGEVDAITPEDKGFRVVTDSWAEREHVGLTSQVVVMSLADG